MMLKIISKEMVRMQLVQMVQKNTFMKINY